MTTDTSTNSGQGAAGEGSGDGAADGNEELTRERAKSQRLFAELTDIKKKFDQFSSMYKDIDPDEARKLKEKLEESERKAAEKDPAKMEEIFNRKMTRLQAEAAEKEAQLLKDLEKYKAENKTLRVTDKVMNEIGDLFNSDAIKFIKREVEQFCDIDDDGTTIVVKDEDGNIQFRNGKYLGIKDFGEMLVERYPSLAKPRGVGGAKDATPGSKKPGGNSGKVPESYAELQAMPNAREVLEHLKKTNPAAVAKILSTVNMGSR
ncbi:MAG: hypothetical protein E6R03_09230 [Hyphomicrobiaceae bacterium]|nr:MAG: hypothetical protein E6R03_09230 [Hyphomicrobiaceae bacterium]